jgi:DNA-binding transcriptional MerR regulator
LKKVLRPADLAQAVGLSTQAVRNYERWGFLPAAERGPQGYRLYGPQHLRAMYTARTLIGAYGWEHALHIMQCVHRYELTSALAVIDARHAFIHRSRLEIEETLKVLRTISIPHPTSAGETRKQMPPLRIGEVARHIGVRDSAIRFWEQQGLIHPARDASSRYRVYDEKQVRALQVVALLRKAGYGFETIDIVLAQLSAGTPEQALAAAEKRLQELAEVSRRCFDATAALWKYVEELAGSKS